jgi:hypothetical protein
MLYENEFRTLKAIHARLPEAQREIVSVLAALPPLAVVVYGAVMLPLGLMGIGGLLTLATASTLATAAMMAGATGQMDADKIIGLPARAWHALEKAFAAAPANAVPQPVASGPAIAVATEPAATVTMQAPFNTAALRTVAAANDAAPKAPKVAAKGMTSAK